MLQLSSLFGPCAIDCRHIDSFPLFFSPFFVRLLPNWIRWRGFRQTPAKTIRRRNDTTTTEIVVHNLSTFYYYFVIMHIFTLTLRNYARTPTHTHRVFELFNCFPSSWTFVSGWILHTIVRCKLVTLSFWPLGRIGSAGLVCVWRRRRHHRFAVVHCGSSSSRRLPRKLKQ